jgi:hypothetical protein
MEPEEIIPITLESFGRHETRAYRSGELVATFERRCDAELFAAARQLRGTCEDALAALDRKDLICHAEWRQRFYDAVKAANNPSGHP